MCPKPTPPTLAEHYDVTLRYVRDQKLPAAAPRHQPTAFWPKENIALYERYRDWLFSGGISVASSKTIYLPAAGFILGLNLKPHHQLNLQDDLEKLMEYSRARDLSRESLKNCRNALNMFRRFLRLEQGLGEEARVKGFDASVYTRGLPVWLVSELERFQRIQQKNWREARFNQNLHGLWNKLGLTWRFLCLECGVQQLAELKRQHILDYIDKRLDQKYAVATINTELRSLHSFLLFLQDEGYAIPQAVMRLPNLRQPDSLPKYLTDEQVKMLREQVERNVRQAPLPSHRRLALFLRAAFYLLRQAVCVRPKWKICAWRNWISPPAA